MENEKDSRERMGRRIRELRLRKELTQTQLGDLLGKSGNTITGWEKGQVCPDVAMMSKMMMIFNVDANTLMGWGDSQPSSFGVNAETGEFILQLKDSDTANIIKDVMELPKEALGELTYTIEFLKYKYRKG